MWKYFYTIDKILTNSSDEDMFEKKYNEKYFYKNVETANMAKNFYINWENTTEYLAILRVFLRKID